MNSIISIELFKLLLCMIRIKKNKELKKNYNHSSFRISPCMPMTKYLIGTFRVALLAASCAIINKPLQQGTSIVATVNVLILASSIRD